MATLKFDYLAQRFYPREGVDHPLLLFVAPAGEIRSWAGIPRKTFDYQHGFQRTLDDARVGAVAEYFRGDGNNLSPTSIVVGFTHAVSIEPVGNGASSKVQAIKVHIEVPDFGGMSVEELAEHALQELRARLPAAVLSDVDANTAVAVEQALKLQAGESTDDNEPESQSAIDIAVSEEQRRSYLADFYAQLLGYKNRLVPWPKGDQLKEILYSLLRPAIIVDGQHRVFGAAIVDPKIQFAVCAIPDSSWAESVYQFVVVNQKAKPIKPAFLSSIIATSLSGEEIEDVYHRLRASNIDVERAAYMDNVDKNAKSPFRNMIDFEVEGSKGFLQFPGMTRLAQEFKKIDRTHPILLPEGSWNSVEGEWIDYFFAFWWGVRKYFEHADPRLWQEPSDSNPNNLLKIVTLQEIQRLMLDNLADTRMIKLNSTASTEKAAAQFWDGFPPTFFSDEWRKKGLQTSVGRLIIRDAITETRRNIGRKGWGHRRLGLFSD